MFFGRECLAIEAMTTYRCCMRLRDLSFVVVVVILCTLPSIADADADITSLVITGSISPHDLELATTAVSDVLKEIGYTVSTVVISDAVAIAQCTSGSGPKVWECLAPIISDPRSKQAVILSLVDNSSNTRDLTFAITEQVVIGQLNIVVGGRQLCLHCADANLAKDITYLTRTLLHEAITRTLRTLVKIDSTPKGARVVMDGNVVGVTDLSISTFPGEHTVALDLDGYLRESRAFDAIMGMTIDLKIEMRSSGSVHANRDSPTERTTQHKLWLGPHLMLGVGGLAAIIGTVVLMVDQDPQPNPVGTKQPEYYYDTIAPGVGMIASGVITGIVGYIWLCHTRDVIPAVTPIVHGAIVNMTFGF